MERVKKIGRILLPVVLVAGLGAGGWFGFHSEAFQRVLGKREGTKVVLDQTRPEFQSAVVQQRVTSMVPNNPSTVTLTTTVTIDRASQRAKSEHARGLTGLDAAQTSVGAATPPEVVGYDVWTPEARFATGTDDTTPWSRHPRSAISLRGSLFDPYLVPVLNDVIGLELATLEHRSPVAPTVPDTAAPGDASVAPVPNIAASPPAEVTDLRRWSMDLAAFSSLSPVALQKTPFDDLSPSTRADVTMGFDDTGVLRYLQVTVDPTRVPPSDVEARTFSFEWSVLELSDTPAEIELPTDFVDGNETTDRIWR